MKTLTESILALVLSLSLFTACGGSTNTDDSGNNPPAAPPTKATVTLTSVVTGTIPQDTVIEIYDVTLTLPPGVTVKSTVSPYTDDGVITLATPTASALVWGMYTAATPSVPGMVRIVAANVDGFSPGDIADVHTDIADGYQPRATDFSLPTFSAAGWTTAGQGGSVDLTSQLTVTASTVLE